MLHDLGHPRGFKDGGAQFCTPSKLCCEANGFPGREPTARRRDSTDILTHCFPRNPCIMQIHKNGANAGVSNQQHDMDGREPSAIRRYQNRQPVQQDPTSKDANTPVQIRNGNSGKEEPKEDHGAWGPIFKDRDHFVEMHIC
ncbi:PREDICTED: uncharacterized protein LOC109469309 [Branchiostoma belcheri]|uniref:Uncharacterized protein LOC109469309 n=1 Tax=Branchiostoma belcheri TaxID=7741 RepID=A0A6P4Y332_BRABE|nr:PREDICTED: uncharacterized protein LOC109469309 [Branchiostoma belcheri]